MTVTTNATTYAWRAKNSQTGAKISSDMAALRRRIEEGQPGLRVDRAAELPRRVREDQLQRRPDVALDEMAAPRAPLGIADHDVGVELRLVAVERDVAHDWGVGRAFLVNGVAGLAAVTVLVAIRRRRRPA
jgi:hypothetical protein